jgi:hypothetical protein
MMPRLTEVFVFQEANVTSLAQMNKLPLPVANHINKLDRKYAPEIAKIFAASYRKSLDDLLKNPSELEDYESGPISGLVDNFIQEREWRVIKKAIEDNPKKKDEIIRKVVEFEKTNKTHDGTIGGGTQQGNEFLALMRPYRPTGPDPDEVKGRAFVKFPDGFFWVKLSQEECDSEGEDMQHCGHAGGDMYSLRDPQGKPHVTLDYVPGDNEIPQLRGKQNDPPQEKYWKYLPTIIKKLGNPSIQDGETLGNSPLGGWLEKHGVGGGDGA